MDLSTNNSPWRSNAVHQFSKTITRHHALNLPFFHFHDDPNHHALHMPRGPATARHHAPFSPDIKSCTRPAANKPKFRTSIAYLGSRSCGRVRESPVLDKCLEDSLASATLSKTASRWTKLVQKTNVQQPNFKRKASRNGIVMRTTIVAFDPVCNQNVQKMTATSFGTAFWVSHPRTNILKQEVRVDVLMSILDEDPLAHAASDTT